MKSLLLTAVALSLPSIASAAISLTNAPFVETFDGYAGTAATVPANFTVAGSTVHNGFLTSGTSSYSNTNGWYALRDDSDLADRALGSRAPAGVAAYTITFTVTNNTGGAIPGLAFTYATEQYTGAATTATSTITFTGSTDGTTFNTANLAGDLSTAAAVGNPDVVFADPIITARAASYTAPIAEGASASFRFTFIPGGSGTRAIWGIDDLTIQAIPEPTALAFSALAIPLLRRRRA